MRVIKRGWAAAQQAARLECERECERAFLSLLAPSAGWLGCAGTGLQTVVGTFLCTGFLTAGLCSRFMGGLRGLFDGSCCITCLVEVQQRCTAAALWFPLQAYLTVPFSTFTKPARSQQRCAESVLFMRAFCIHSLVACGRCPAAPTYPDKWFLGGEDLQTVLAGVWAISGWVQGLRALGGLRP